MVIRQEFRFLFSIPEQALHPLRSVHKMGYDTFVERTLVERNIGRTDHWSNGTLVERNIGRMEHWSNGTLVEHSSNETFV